MNAYYIGFVYELRAARYVKKRGMRVLDKRFRAAGGELDLIAKDGDSIVFIEVKARPDKPLGAGVDAVGTDKRRRIQRAASVYLRQTGMEDLPCRYDILEFSRAGIVYMENAF